MALPATANLITDRDDMHAPCVSQPFTSFAAQKDLSGADAPRNAKHLPCAITVQVHTALDHFDYLDVNGTANSIIFEAVGTFHLPHVAPATIETTTTVARVTVWWNVRLSGKV